LSNNVEDSAAPQIAVSSNNVHIVWHNDQPAADFDIIYRRSTDGGASFMPEKNLSSNDASSGFPDIAVSSNNVHVVWIDFTPGESDIMYRRSLDNGNAFPNVIKNIGGNAGFSEFPSIAASGNNVHVVWHDSTPGNSDILYRKSVNGGSTFPNIIKNLSDNLGQSISPAIAVSGDAVPVVWKD
jgi:hypothetical protein